MRIEGLVAKLEVAPYRAGRTGAWVQVRQMVVVDALVVGVAGDARQPTEVVLARRDDRGELRQIEMSLPLAAVLCTEVGGRVRPTGEPAVEVSTGMFGRGYTQYLPVHPDLVAEVEAESSVESFANRLRPRVYRVRPDLRPDDAAM